jgi:hypothetical protein
MNIFSLISTTMSAKADLFFASGWSVGGEVDSGIDCVAVDSCADSWSEPELFLEQSMNIHIADIMDNVSGAINLVIIEASLVK